MAVIPQQQTNLPSHYNNMLSVISWFLYSLTSLLVACLQEQQMGGVLYCPIPKCLSFYVSQMLICTK
jgi:hypothetical protein